MSEKALLPINESVIKWLVHLMEVRNFPEEIRKIVRTCSKKGFVAPKRLQLLARKLGVSLVDLLGSSEPQPPQLPAADFRKGISFSWSDQNAVNLYSLIGLLSTKQAWLSSIREEEDIAPCSLVLSQSPNSVPDEDTITRHLRGLFGVEREDICAFTFSEWVKKCESLGVIVVCTHCVGFNTKQKIDPDYVRGFTLGDRWAPVVFVNSEDAETARRFTLCHELVHVTLSESAISDPDIISPWHNREALCNRVAAELLMPRAYLVNARVDLPRSGDWILWRQAVESLAKKYRVSPLAMTVRLYTLGMLPRAVAESLIPVFRSRRKKRSSTVPRKILHRVYECNGRALTHEVLTRLHNSEISLREAKNVLGISYGTLVKLLEQLDQQPPATRKGGNPS